MVGSFSSKFYTPVTRFHQRAATIFLFNYLQLLWSYAIFSVTTHLTSHAQNVHHRRKRTQAFSDIFPKQLGIFSPNFTDLLHVPIYVRLQIFIQLSPTMTKLCYIKCDHWSIAGPTVRNSLPDDLTNPACVSDSFKQFLNTILFSLH